MSGEFRSGVDGGTRTAAGLEYESTVGADLFVPPARVNVPWQGASVDSSSTLANRMRQREDTFFQDFDALTSMDRRRRTDESLDKSVKNLTDLGRQNPYALNTIRAQSVERLQTAYKQGSPTEMFKAYRDTISTTLANGNLRYEGVVPLFNPDRIPQTAGNLDMGGLSLVTFLNARQHLNAASRLAGRLSGQMIDGKIVDSKEVEDLEKFGARIDEKVNAIEGKHDLDAAVVSMKDYLRPSVYLPLLDPWTRAERRTALYAERERTFVRDLYHKPFDTLNESVNNAKARNIDPMMDSDSRRIAGKLFRDQTLARIVHADLKLDDGDKAGAQEVIEGKGKLFTGPNQLTPRTSLSIGDTLTVAERLAPGNLDLPKLRQMTLDLQKKAAGRN